MCCPPGTSPPGSISRPGCCRRNASGGATAKGAKLAVEESVYIGAEARRTSQVVLLAEGGEDTVQWAISRIAAAAPGEAAGG